MPAAPVAYLLLIFRTYDPDLSCQLGMSPHYKLGRVTGDGDCFFQAIATQCQPKVSKYFVRMLCGIALEDRFSAGSSHIKEECFLAEQLAHVLMKGSWVGPQEHAALSQYIKIPCHIYTCHALSGFEDSWQVCIISQLFSFIHRVFLVIPFLDIDIFVTLSEPRMEER